MSFSVSNKKNYNEYYGRELSREFFNLILGILIGYGFFMNLITTIVFNAFFIDVVPFLFVAIAYIILAIVGIVLMNKSSSPVFSFLGYNMLVVPIGMMLSYVLPGYAFSTILITCIVTLLCTGCMMVVSMIFPDFFCKLGVTLTISLLICIVAEIILLLFGFNLGIFDWIIALIFCGYIGFDWAKINSRGVYTLDYAVDSAGELYLDIINLFLRILSILGRNDD